MRSVNASNRSPSSDSAQGSCLAPRLEVITFGFISSLQRPDFTEMIESRWKVDDPEDVSRGEVVARLRIIKITTLPPLVSISTLDHLRQMQDEGLDIAIFSSQRDGDKIL